MEVQFKIYTCLTCSFSMYCYQCRISALLLSTSNITILCQLTPRVLLVNSTHLHICILPLWLSMLSHTCSFSMCYWFSMYNSTLLGNSTCILLNTLCSVSSATNLLCTILAIFFQSMRFSTIEQLTHANYLHHYHCSLYHCWRSILTLLTPFLGYSFLHKCQEAVTSQFMHSLEEVIPAVASFCISILLQQPGKFPSLEALLRCSSEAMIECSHEVSFDIHGSTVLLWGGGKLTTI